MKLFRRIASIILILLIALQAFPFTVVYAVDTTPQAPPQKLQLDQNSQKPIGYDQFDGNYVDMQWDNVYASDAVNTYAGVNSQEVLKYKTPATALTARIQVTTMSVTAPSSTYRMKNLKSGTVYFIDATAYHTHIDAQSNTEYSSATSLPSNRLKVLTDIAIDAYTYDDNQIKITWDDVWDVNGRINYKLYISQSSSFTDTPPIYITPEQIEPNGPVKINTAEGKLEYIHTVRDAASVYYVKIAPDINDSSFLRSAESQIKAVGSTILVSTAKMSAVENGTIWRLDWTPVITNMGSSGLKISYQIYKGVTGSSELPLFLGSVEDTSFFITLPSNEPSNYYFIVADVKKSNGDDFFVFNGKKIDIKSKNITVREQGLPTNPPAPELVDRFDRAPGDPIISYDDRLTSTGATILWRMPLKGNGSEDLDTMYDIWLFTDPNLMTDTPDNSKIASNFKVSDSNYVQGKAGYQYVLNNLSPNSTYYFKIMAKKSFVTYVNNTLSNVTYTSEASIRVVITKPSGSVEQPVIPSRPPLKLKKTPPPDNKYVVTATSAVIQIKDKWYEKFNSSTGKWEYVRTEKDPSIQGDIPPYNPNTAPPDNINYRMVQYDDGVTLNVGVTEYVYGMSYNTLLSMPANKVSGVPAVVADKYVDNRIYNPDQTEDPALNVDNKPHNIDITLNDLTANKTHVVWIQAVRGNRLVSGPSDPIIITTNPDTGSQVEKPTVPILSNGLRGDTYVDLMWNMISGYNYYLKYGTVEDIASATGSLAILPQDLLYKSYYRVTGLQPGTVYYFWIQAEAVNSEGDKSQSDWSDSYSVVTSALKPPATPRGFGVKSVTGAVTKNSITLEWLKETGIEYKLEVDGDINYKNKKEYNTGAVSEYTVDGLKSNYRYYIRLYAYDPTKKLYSEATQSITVRTERSRDDYDADQDIENVITGDIVVKDTSVLNGSWTVSITGTNADRFVQMIQTDGVLDYRLDMSNPPSNASKFIVNISGKIFRALNSMKENFIVVTANDQLIIRPSMFSEKQDADITRKVGSDYNFVLSVAYPENSTASNTKNLTFKTGVSEIRVTASDGTVDLPVNRFNRPLKVLHTYSGEKWYRDGVTSAYIYDNTASAWNKIDTSSRYDVDNNKGYLTYETTKAGIIVIADTGKNYFDDIPGHWAASSINNVASVHRLKSIAGRTFNPDRNISTMDAVKFMLDCMDYNYGDDYMTVALKAGIIRSDDIRSKDTNCSRENAISMAVRLYELKSGKRASPSLNNPDLFYDMSDVNPVLQPKVRFAVENGLAMGKDQGRLAPKDPITRAETITLLEKVMALAGEIE